MRTPRPHPLPGLAMALDPEAVAGLLQIRLQASGLRGCVLAARILDVRYRPGRPCWILYQLRLRDADGLVHRLWLTGRVLRDGESPDPVPEDLAARYRSRPRAVLSEPVFLLDEVPMAVYPFPVDGSLPGLFDAADAAAMKLHLGRLWAGRRTRVRRVRVETRGYTPHARAAFFYEALVEEKRSGLPEMRRLVGKMHAKKSASRLFADQWALWSASRGRLPLAPPVGFLGGVGLTLQEQVRGERLGGLVDRPGFVKHVRRTARILASLHGLRFPLSTRRRAEDEADVVRRWAGVLTAIRPDLVPRMARVEERLIGNILARHKSSAPIHADFHHTNLLVDGDVITVIDFDEMAWGDPMVDVGRFLASLRVPARRAFGRLDALADAGGMFLEEYVRRSGGDERRARLFEAASLLVAAGSSFRVQRGDYAEEAGLLLDECERVLALSEAGTPWRPVVMSDSGDAPRVLSPEHRKPWLRNEVYLHALLEPDVRRVYGADLADCRIEAAEAGNEDRRILHLRGRLDGVRWEKSFLGITGRERGGFGFLARLQRLAAALAEHPDAFLLPRVLAYVKPLALMVWEIPDGERLPVVIGRDEHAPARIARAMAALHRVELELDGEWSWARAMARIEERLQRPAVRGIVDRGRAIHAAARTADGNGEPRPALRSVHPRHVILSGERISLDRIEDVVLAPPGLDAGDFLARLALLGIDSGLEEDVARVSYTFREAYGEADPGAKETGLFEAGFLLQFALHRVEHAGDSVKVDRILTLAEGRVRDAAPGTRIEVSR